MGPARLFGAKMALLVWYKGRRKCYRRSVGFEPPKARTLQINRECVPTPTPTPPKGEAPNIFSKQLQMATTYAYFGYLNGTFADISGVINSWARISRQLIVYQHGPDDKATKDHCHVLVLDIQLDKKQLYKRKEFKELQLDGKKKQFGFDTYIPGLETLSYMSKGIYDPVYNKGFSDTEIQEAKAKGYCKKKPLFDGTNNEQVVNTSSKRVTRVDIASEAYAEYMDSTERALAAVEGIWHKEDIIDAVKKVCIKYKKGLDFDNVAKICQTVIARVAPRYWAEKIKCRL